MSIMAYTEAGYKQFTVRPIDVDNVFDPPSGSKVLVLLEGKVQVTDYADKDGQKVFGSSSVYHVRDNKLFGVVIEQGDQA